NQREGAAGEADSTRSVQLRQGIGLVAESAAAEIDHTPRRRVVGPAQEPAVVEIERPLQGGDGAGVGYRDGKTGGSCAGAFAQHAGIIERLLAVAGAVE